MNKILIDFDNLGCASSMFKQACPLLSACTRFPHATRALIMIQFQRLGEGSSPQNHPIFKRANAKQAHLNLSQRGGGWGWGLFLSSCSSPGNPNCGGAASSPGDGYGSTTFTTLLPYSQNLPYSQKISPTSKNKLDGALLNARADALNHRVVLVFVRMIALL